MELFSPCSFRRLQPAVTLAPHPTCTPACCDTAPLDPFFQGHLLRKLTVLGPVPDAPKERPIVKTSEFWSQEGFIDREGRAPQDERTNSQSHLKRARSSGVFYIRGRQDRGGREAGGDCGQLGTAKGPKGNFQISHGQPYPTEAGSGVITLGLPSRGPLVN